MCSGLDGFSDAVHTVITAIAEEAAKVEQEKLKVGQLGGQYTIFTL